MKKRCGTCHRLWATLTSHQGSTLLLVMITLSLLVILGTVLLSAVVTQTRINVMYKKQNQNFYYAESGLEKTYGEVAMLVEDVIRDSKSASESQLTALITNLRHNPTDIRYATYIQEDNSLNAEEVTKEYSRLYKLNFKSLMNNKMTDDVINNTLNTTISPIIDVNRKQIFDTLKDEYILGVKSTFRDNDNLQKTIRADIVIKPEEMPIAIMSKRESFTGVPLWKYVLTSGEDIHIKGTYNTVKVTGDVYAYSGDNTTDFAKVKTVSRNGISLIGNNASLDVTGNMITRSTVQTKGDNAQLNYYNGNMLCSSLATQGESSDVMISDGNIITKDDIELNGVKSSIQIDGSYFGFSRGEYVENNDDGTTTTVMMQHDASSSILINIPPYDTNGNPLFGNGRSNGYLQITGKPNSYDLIQSVSGVYIGGTSHVYFDNGTTITDYTTAESVSIRGNYFVYSIMNEDIDSDYHKDKISFNKFTDRRSNVDYDITLATHKKEPLKALNVPEKRDYFKEIIATPPYDMLIEVGNGDNTNKIIDISPDKIIFAAGLTTYESDDNGAMQPDETAKVEGREPGIVGISSIYNNYIQYMTKEVNDKLTAVDDAGTNYENPIEKYFAFTENINRISPYNGNKQIVYVETASTDNLGNRSKLYIQGENGSVPPSAKVIDLFRGGGANQITNGIIITKEDIHITGKIDYTGTIITTGNIIMDDSTSDLNRGRYRKVFSYPTGDYLEELIADNPDLRYQFQNGYPVKVSESTVESSVNNVKIEGFIDIENWNLE